MCNRWGGRAELTSPTVNHSCLGISTAAIVARIDAGESLADVAADYQVNASAITDAIVYERAA